jgi:prepilin peptidase CpaA
MRLATSIILRPSFFSFPAREQSALTDMWPPPNQSAIPPAVTGSATNFGALLVLAVMLTVAVYVELKESRIPNWLTLSGMALGLLIAYLNGKSWFWSSVGGLILGFGFLFIFYIFGGLGGGDVKLMGAAGALMGADLIRPALFYTALIGGFLAIVMVIWRRDFWMRIAWAGQRLAFWQKRSGSQPAPSAPVTVPYGVAIAAGCVVAVWIRGV